MKKILKDGSVPSKDYNKYVEDANNNTSLRDRARLDYYNQRLDSTLYGKDFDKYRNIKNNIYSMADRGTYADSTIKSGAFTNSLDEPTIKKTLGNQYDDYVSIRTNPNYYTQPTAGTKNPNPLIYGMRNSFVAPIPQHQNTAGFVADMSWRPDTGYRLNTNMADRQYADGGRIGADMASGALSGAASGFAIGGPWGAAVGGFIGGGTQLVKGLVANKQQEDALVLQQQQQAEAGQMGIQQKYMGPWATGGITPNGMPIEVERGEVLRNPNDGSLAKISDSANTHAQGGVNIGAEGGTEIYGNRRVKSGRFKGLMYKEAADKIRKEIARLEKN